jgi:hypothetical protein
VHDTVASEHALPGQHGSPAAPHCAHKPFAQARPAPVHVSGSQHGWAAAPQAVQLPFAHTTPLAVHWSLPPPPPPPPQHAWPPAPQFPQLPLAQVPPMPGHAEPADTHVLFTQQPPPQSFASQQG